MDKGENGDRLGMSGACDRNRGPEENGGVDGGVEEGGSLSRS